MGRQNISKEELYEGVKALVDADASFIHLHQHKLFTLFSIAFQYFLYTSTKNPGHYIVRIEDGRLAEKLSYKAKDESTRKFLQKLILSRKVKCGPSTFYLDYFHIGSWSLVSDLPRNMVKGALIVKNTIVSPLQETPDLEIETSSDPEEGSEKDSSISVSLSDFPEDYYYTSLKEFVPQLVAIGHNCDFPGSKAVSISFIKEKEERPAKGVKLAKDLSFDDLDEA